MSAPTDRCRASLFSEGKLFGCIRDAGHPLDDTITGPDGMEIDVEKLEMHRGIALDKTPAQWLDGAPGAIPHGAIPERANREGESQPLPVGNDEESSHSVAIKLLQARLAVGIRRYGQPLQPNNGRDSLLDAIEENCDLLVYLITEWRERHPGVEFPLR